MVIDKFFGNPDSTRRNVSLELLLSINRFKPPSEMGWCVVGDFNEIASQDKRYGGRKRKEG